MKLPILPHLRKIIEKRKGKLPYAVSNQKLNSYIKEVAKLAGITGRIECQTTKGGKRIKHFVEKWGMVSSLTARHSFASILYQKGVPPQTIMKATDHKTLQAFMAYIKLDEKEHMDIILKAWG